MQGAMSERMVCLQEAEQPGSSAEAHRPLLQLASLVRLPPWHFWSWAWQARLDSVLGEGPPQLGLMQCCRLFSVFGARMPMHCHLAALIVVHSCI